MSSKNEGNGPLPTEKKKNHKRLHHLTCDIMVKMGGSKV